MVSQKKSKHSAWMKNDITIRSYCFPFAIKNERKSCEILWGWSETAWKAITKAMKHVTKETKKYQFGFGNQIWFLFAFFLHFIFLSFERWNLCKKSTRIVHVRNRKAKAKSNYIFVIASRAREERNKNFNESGNSKRSTSLLLNINVYGHWWLYCSARARIIVFHFVAFYFGFSFCTRRH